MRYGLSANSVRSNGSLPSMISASMAPALACSSVRLVPHSPSVRLSVRLSLCLSVCLSVCLFVCLSVCLSVCLRLRSPSLITPRLSPLGTTLLASSLTHSVAHTVFLGRSSSTYGLVSDEHHDWVWLDIAMFEAVATSYGLIPNLLNQRPPKRGIQGSGTLVQGRSTEVATVSIGKPR